MNQPIYQQSEPSIFTTEPNLPNQDNFFVVTQDYKKRRCKNGFIQCCCI